MRFLASFFLLTISLPAVDQAYLRSLSGNSCKITAATNATPIVLTFTAGCTFAIGDPVIIYHVRGNYSANGVRKIKNDGNFSTTTAAITDTSGTDIAGSGTFVAQSTGQVGTQPVTQPWIAPATLFTLNSHPRGVFTPSILSSFTGNVAGTRGDHNGITYKAMGDIYTSWSSRYADLFDSFATGQRMNVFTVAALKWYADGQPTGTPQNMPLWLLQNPSLPSVGGTTACDETVAYCGASGGQLPDYLMTNMQALLWDYELMYSTITSGQRQTAANFALNDLDTLHYGLNNAGSGCTKIPFQAGAGTVTATGYSFSTTAQPVTLVGSGTNFGQSGGPHVGDVIYIGTTNSPGIDDAIISAITDATHATAMIGATSSSRDAAGTVWSWARQWADTGDCGAIFYTKHHVGSEMADPTNYPSRGGETYDISNNSAMRFAGIYMQIGLSFCGQDDRGCLAASMMSAFMYDHVQSYANQSMGKTGSQDAYSRATSDWLYTTFQQSLNASVNGGYDLIGLSGRDHMYEYIYNNLPTEGPALDADYGLNVPLHYGASGNNSLWADGGGFRGAIINSYFFPTHAPYFYWWLDHVQGWLTQANMGRFDALWSPWYMIFYDPSISETNISGLTNQYLFSTPDTAKCATGGFMCSLYNSPEMDAVSRTGLNTSTDTVLFLNSQSVSIGGIPTDGHADFGCPACVSIFRNAPLLAGDQGAFPNQPGANLQGVIGATTWSIAGATLTGIVDLINTSTVTTTPDHGLQVGYRVTISGVTTSGGTALNNTFFVASTPTSKTFTIATSGVTDGTYTDSTMAVEKDPVNLDFVNWIEVGGGILPGAGCSIPDCPVQVKGLNCDSADTQLITVPKWGGGTPSGDSTSRYAYALVDATQAYCSSLGLTRGWRHWAHLKVGPDYIVEFVDFASSSGTSYLERFHYFLNNISEGTAISSSTGNNGGTFTNTQTAASARLLTSVLPLTSNTVMTSHYGNGPTYGAGSSSLLTACAEDSGSPGSCDLAATSANWLVVHKPSTSPTDTMPTLTQPTTANFATVQIADGTTPKLVSFATGGTTYSSWSGTSTFSGTGQYLIAGITAGSYTVTVGGTPVSGSPVTAAANDNTLYFEGGSGAVVVSSAAPGNGGSKVKAKYGGNVVIH